MWNVTICNLLPMSLTDKLGDFDVKALLASQGNHYQVSLKDFYVNRNWMSNCSILCHIHTSLTIIKALVTLVEANCFQVHSWHLGLEMTIKYLESVITVVKAFVLRFYSSAASAERIPLSYQQCSQICYHFVQDGWDPRVGMNYRKSGLLIYQELEMANRLLSLPTPFITEIEGPLLTHID